MRVFGLGLVSLSLLAACGDVDVDTPRIVPLYGTAPGIVTGMPSWTERSTLYLPNGWHAGAEAWLDLQAFTFDAAATGHPSCHLARCALTLDPGDGCAHYHYDRAELVRGDQVFIIDGDLVACDDGTTPPPPSAILTATVPNSERAGLRVPLPTSEFVVRTAAPFDLRTAMYATLSVDGVDLAEGTVSFTPERILITPLGTLRLGATIAAGLADVRDVMGRTFVDPAALGALSTTAVVADLTFAVAPPEGALVTNGAATALDAGVLCLGGGFSMCTIPAEHPLGVALALADPGTSTWLSISLGSGAHWSTRVYAEIARADGTTSAPVYLGVPAAEVPIPPGVGPIWLLIYAIEQPPGPCPSEPGGPSVCLDSLALH